MLRGYEWGFKILRSKKDKRSRGISVNKGKGKIWENGKKEIEKLFHPMDILRID